MMEKENFLPSHKKQQKVVASALQSTPYNPFRCFCQEDCFAMQVYLAQPRGFCAGVTRAITIVERALEVFGAPVYVRHEIVHNKTVVENLRERGAIFVDDLNMVPQGATLVFSAHGVPKAVEAQARERGLRIFDATCPLVTKVHREVARMRAEGKTIIMIGHAGHPEVEGTMGQVADGIELVQDPSDVEKLPLSEKNLSYVTQTTISVDDAKNVIDALKKRFPEIHEPKKADICYATQNRQDAVKALAFEAKVDLILVIGSVTSSNSNRLKELGSRCGVPSYLVDSAEHIDPAWLKGVQKVGITAGASAPEALVQGVVAMLQRDYGAEPAITMPGAQEGVAFPMPKGLWSKDLETARSHTQANTDN